MTDSLPAPAARLIFHAWTTGDSHPAGVNATYSGSRLRLRRTGLHTLQDARADPYRGPVRRHTSDPPSRSLFPALPLAGRLRMPSQPLWHASGPMRVGPVGSTPTTVRNREHCSQLRGELK